MLRWLVLAVAVLTPAAATKIAVEAAVEPLGRRVGAGMAAVAAQAGWTRPPHREPPWFALVAPEFDSTVQANPRPGLGRSPHRRRPAAAPSNPARGIRVSAGTVLRLAELGARPVGIPVPASADRPAGIALHGVSGLGIGLLEGDILVRAAGQPALDPGAVISSIIASRGARVPTISGEIWRSGRRFPVVVEQPYLTDRRDLPKSSATEDDECGDDKAGRLPCDAGAPRRTGLRAKVP